MKIQDLQPGLLVQSGRELFQVDTVGAHSVTARVLYPVTPRTTAHTLTVDEIGGLQGPTKKLCARYETAWGFR